MSLARRPPEIPWLDLEDRDLRGARIGLNDGGGASACRSRSAVAEAVRDVPPRRSLGSARGGSRPIKADPHPPRCSTGSTIFWAAPPASWDDISKLAPEQRAKIPALHPSALGRRRARSLSGLAVIARLQPHDWRCAAAWLRAPSSISTTCLSPTAPIVACFPPELAGCPTDDPQKPFRAYRLQPWLWKHDRAGRPASDQLAASPSPGCRSGCRSSGAAFRDDTSGVPGASHSLYEKTCARSARSGPDPARAGRKKPATETLRMKPDNPSLPRRSARSSPTTKAIVPADPTWRRPMSRDPPDKPVPGRAASTVRADKPGLRTCPSR